MMDVAGCNCGVAIFLIEALLSMVHTGFRRSMCV